MKEEQECIICYGPGRLKTINVFRIPNTADDLKQNCKHTYCAPCMEEYLSTLTIQFSCPVDKCRTSCDTVYALDWVKGRNRQLYEEMTLKIVKTQLQAIVRPHKAYFDVDKSLLDFCQQTGARPCPGCKHLVEKRQGCNQIICKCNTLFCYCCGYPIGSRELDAFHNEVLLNVQRCRTCSSRHAEEVCPIRCCPFCQSVGHSSKDCPQRLKSCRDCGCYDDHAITTCTNILLKKRLKDQSKPKVEKLKYLGDYVPNIIDDTNVSILDDDEEEAIDHESRNYIIHNIQEPAPISLLAFVTSK
eukprot:Awhi_evm2s9900